MRTGAPTKYKKEFAEQAYKLTLLGFTDANLCFYFGIEEQTLSNWKRKHRDLLGAVRAGKEIADANVAESFYKRAKGYNYIEVTIEEVDGNETKTKTVSKHLPPDAGAALNWLKNRQKDLWRDKQTIETNFDKFTDEQLDAIINKLKNYNQ